MQPSFIRPAALAFATVALAIGITVLPPTPAQSATFTFNDPNCSSFSYNANTSTLSCVVSAPPVCTVTGSAAGTINTTDTLTASCSPVATSWAWTGGNCAGQTGASCAALESSPVTRGYTVAGTNGTFVGSASPTFNVVWSNTPPAAPSGCSITSNPASLPAAGGPIALTAQCSGGGAVATWTWSGPTATTSGNTATATLTSTTQFSVQASNAGGSANPSITVQVSTGGGGGISCSGFSQTAVLTENWANPIRMFTSNAGGFPSDGAVVVVFTTSSLSSPNKNGGIIGAEYGSPTATRIATLSTQPCDFGPGLETVSSGTIVLNFLAPGSTPGGLPVLQPSTTYYINIMNAPNSGCTGSNCNMFFDFGKPRGT